MLKSQFARSPRAKNRAMLWEKATESRSAQPPTNKAQEPQLEAACRYAFSQVELEIALAALADTMDHVDAMHERKLNALTKPKTMMLNNDTFLILPFILLVLCVRAEGYI